MAQRYLCPANGMYAARWWVRRRTALVGRLGLGLRRLPQMLLLKTTLNGVRLRSVQRRALTRWDSFLEVEPGPVPLETSLEPVADVADAVSPSIVVIISDEGQGSGVVWDAENGYIVTNNHVVELSTNVDVEFPDGQNGGRDCDRR